MIYLLDSVILIDHFNNVEAATTFLREHRWKLPDAIQAAVAQHHGLKLVTRNTKDFPADKFDFVMTSY